MEKEQLQQLFSKFGKAFREVTSFIDSSHGEQDRRLNYILDDAYVLKLNSPVSMWEERLQQIARLTDRYRAIGVYCPRLIPALGGGYSVMHEGLVCYVEEYAQYPICGEEVVLPRSEVIAHLGTLAARFSGVDLTDIHSMWSIIDLAPLDGDVDEKQENANLLTKALEEAGEGALARQVADFNEALRRRILEDFRALPRCVFQGDLNSANYLHSGGHFAGLIDFNMSGTDVNINVFANETNDFPDDEQLDQMTVPEILEGMKQEQARLLDVIWKSYTMNDLEQKQLPCFQKLCDLFQWPNVCSLRRWLKDDARRDKALALIRGIMQEKQEETI
ncbi:MAG: phosphotransferase [Eubacteriales bacterium]|nr:phosphotransferase [Eubacteriales bacterium]